MSDVKEIEKLREEIRRHDRKYYIDAAPEISDQQYDELMERLKQLEASHPDSSHARQPHEARWRRTA